MGRKPRQAAQESARADGSHGPPLQVTPEGVEPHPHRTGHVRTDRILAGAAIFMSLLSLAVAYKHGLIMRDLVSANSWPLLQYSSGNTDEKNMPSISLSVQNAGVGPAIVKRFRYIYGGRSYSNPYALLRDCCGYVITDPDPTKVHPGAPISGPVEGTVIKGGENRVFFQVGLAAENRQAWRRLDEARFKLQFDACYCSVLGECWRSDLVGVEPQRVESCPVADKRDD